MRTAAICPACATYINAACVIYDGDYLTNIKVAPLDALDIILGKINTNLIPLTGSGVPTSVPVYIGQFYVDINSDVLYIGLSTIVPDWGEIGVIITTTTTSTSTSTSSTSTTSTTTTAP